MEPPECPVCLQPFDGESTIPRVLACGHSTCQACLIDLPKPPFACTIRCPACTQLVTYPHPQGPSALPKNIDLLRISSAILQSNPNQPKPQPKPNTPTLSDFIPSLWSHEFYHNWKNWVIPQDSILVDSNVEALDGCFLHGSIINWKTPSRCSTKCHQEVGLFKVGSFVHNDEYRFQYSYIAKAMWVLFKMTDKSLTELELILTLSLNEHQICTVYGLWYNKGDEHLYIVSERKHTNLLSAIALDIEVDISSFAVIGMDLCETVIKLHNVELVSGCFSLSCFRIDDFGHIFVDLNEVLFVGTCVQKMIKEAVTFTQKSGGKQLENEPINDLLDIHVFPSPELLVEFVQKEGVDLEITESTCVVDYSSDVWSLGCILLAFLVGKSFIEETHSFLCSYILNLINKNTCDCEELYKSWLDKVSSLLDNNLGSDHVTMKELLHNCLCLDLVTRPLVNDVWKCLRNLIIKPKFDITGSTNLKTTNGSKGHCLILGDLLWSLKKSDKLDDNNGVINEFKDVNLAVEGDVIDGIQKSCLKCIDLKGHLDCISGLTIGGGFLFSCSFDKTINVWSLQDFNHVHTFKGHEHKIMAVVYVNSEPPLCISADNGGEILIWLIKFPFQEKPFKKINEEKDWRYTGIHALTISTSTSSPDYFYTGSGDKSIKAWSMQDFSLSCSMNGHKSVVSSLAICNEVLYSGSWDGTIRLWCLSDHSPLAVFNEEAPGPSVLSLAAYDHTLVAAHENGSIKIWNKDVLLNPISSHSSSVFSICMEGKWLFSGGWNKTVLVHNVSGDDEDATEIGSIGGNSVVTALLYWQGKLFVGHADRIIKVYSFGG